jgi:hypothetical protein
MSNRIGLPVDSVSYDRHVVTRSRVITSDPRTGRLVERIELKVGSARSFAADLRGDHTGAVAHRIHC